MKTVILESNTWIENFLLPLLVIIVAGLGGLIYSRLHNKIKIRINYDNSFWTTVEGSHYVVFNVAIINKRDVDLNTVTFRVIPTHKLTDNIWSSPNMTRDGSATMIIGSMEYIKDSLGEEPIDIRAHDRKNGNLVFESPTPYCYIGDLIINYQDKQITVKVHHNKIRRRNLS